MKLKFLCLLFLSFTMVNAQTKKTKKAAPSKTTTTITKVATTSPVASSKPTGVLPVENPNEGIFADIETNKGKILVQLEYKKAPVTVANFIALSEGTNTQVAEKFKSKKFYDGLKFHRVIKDFMIQGGDPDGNGSGGPGYAFKDEFTDLKHHKEGILSMANSGPKTNGSQFFITHKATPWLDGKHTVFGLVISGMNVVNAIEQNDEIKTITIIRKGAEAQKFNATKLFSDYFANKAEDDKKQAAIDMESKKAQLEIENSKKKEYNDKYASVFKAKADQLSALKTKATKSDTGLQYVITHKGTGKKPENGANVFIHYAGYLEDGSLFDSSYEDVNKTYGKFDQSRANQNGYRPMGAKAGSYQFIPGFIEGLNLMSIGEKATLFIPSNLGYGERGAGGVIPPNANIIFEVELLDAMPPIK